MGSMLPYIAYMDPMGFLHTCSVFFSGCVLNTLQDAAPVLAPVPQPDHDHRMG